MMGMNYYVAKNYCECCKRYDEEYHIGKSSWGWSFTFQGYKYDNLTSWKQWKEFLRDQLIRDENGEIVDYLWLCQQIEGPKSPQFVRNDGHKNSSHNEAGKTDKYPWFDPEYDWDDEDGYSFTSREFS